MIGDVLVEGLKRDWSEMGAAYWLWPPLKGTIHWRRRKEEPVQYWNITLQTAEICDYIPGLKVEMKPKGLGSTVKEGCAACT